eukprot:TRINITY_DN5388_c0_g1_i1.p1 TRINITY_DN5388_c0_g1~~TRINITY_DN5388_c0_g1_i1.p1  ORF type:complete len:253 (+),score=32.92 TRINITY_DN5388_c0_g1_i1:489-1247(+)
MAASLLLHTVVALDGPFNHESSKHLGIAHQRLTSYEKLHGFLLWASMGFLMPISIILIRMTKAAREQGATRRLEILYYLHVTLQVLAVTLASAGAVLSFMKFDNKFKYTHQKIGLSLYIIVWLQPIVGFLRPERGMKGRPFWYFVHWMLGTGGAILGIVNTYTGFHSYEFFNSKRLKILYILFSVEVAILALFYLIQDRWCYLIQQGYLKSKPIAPSTDSEQQSQQATEIKTNGSCQDAAASLECSTSDLKV